MKLKTYTIDGDDLFLRLRFDSSISGEIYRHNSLYHQTVKREKRLISNRD